MTKKRVLMAINTSWNIYNFRANLVRALTDHGYELVVMAAPDAYTPQLASLGCRYVPLRMDSKGTSPFRDLLLLTQIWRLLRREKPDVYLGYTVKPNIYGSFAARLSGIPVINNITGLGTAFVQETGLTQIVKTMYKCALRWSHAVFFHNADDMAFFVREKLVTAGQAAVLPGSGIDLEKFRPLPKNAAARQEETCFLLVARLLWDKGVGEYVAAARAIRKTHPRTRFQLLGFLDAQNRTAIPRATLEDWMAEGIIEYLGETDDVRPFVGNADCVVLPSYREGTPRSLLEAAAMAKPLIATDVPGCRQVIEPGKNGFLCASRDVQSLTSALQIFLTLSPEEQQAMGRASRMKAEREFDEKAVIARYIEALDAVFQRSTDRD